MAQYGPDGNRDHLDEALLSDYLDDRIEDAETVLAVRAHLGQCDDCRQAAAELRTITVLLAELPAPALPRSFRLTPAMVPVRLLTPEPWFERFQPAMRRATVAAALLLLLVLSADLVSQRPDTSTASIAMSASDRSLAGGAESTGAGGSRQAETSSQEPTPAGAAAAASEAAARVGQATSVSGQAASSGAAADAAATQGTPAPAALAATPAPLIAAGEPPDGKTEVHDVSSAPEPAVIAAPVPSAEPVSGWRVAELALGLVILWLLVATVALPRLRPMRR